MGHADPSHPKASVFDRGASFSCSPCLVTVSSVSSVETTVSVSPGTTSSKWECISAPRSFRSLESHQLPSASKLPVRLRRRGVRVWSRVVGVFTPLLQVWLAPNVPIFCSVALAFVSLSVPQSWDPRSTGLKRRHSDFIQLRTRDMTGTHPEPFFAAGGTTRSSDSPRPHIPTSPHP